MDFVTKWWLKRKAKEHRQTAVLFFALAASITAMLFTVVIQRSVKEPPSFYVDPSAPDFSELVTSLDGSPERSYWRVSSLRDPAFIVGYRGDRGAEVALVNWNRSKMIYETSSLVKLDFGADGEVPRFQPVLLGGDEVFLARLSQDNGWQAVYLIGVKQDGLSLSVESIREDGSGQPFVVGSGQSGCRMLRVGDVDGDGVSGEVLVTASNINGSVSYRAYRWQGGRLFDDTVLTGVVRRSNQLFSGFPDHCSQEQGVYYDETDADGSLETKFLPAQPLNQPEREPLFEEMEM